eukprot:scaffold95244_cov26-Tisochrysis_lutea.AAC.3
MRVREIESSVAAFRRVAEGLPDDLTMSVIVGLERSEHRLGEASWWGMQPDESLHGRKAQGGGIN